MGGSAVHVFASGSYFSPELRVCLFSSWPPNTKRNPSEKSQQTNRKLDVEPTKVAAHSGVRGTVSDDSNLLQLWIFSTSHVSHAGESLRPLCSVHHAQGAGPHHCLSIKRTGRPSLSCQATQGHLSPSILSRASVSFSPCLFIQDARNAQVGGTCEHSTFKAGSRAQAGLLHLWNDGLGYSSAEKHGQCQTYLLKNNLLDPVW